jgi:P27 family predicted phage terminase small subunit
MAGRNRIPEEVKKERGTWRADRAGFDPTTTKPAKVPSPPAGLNDLEKKYWRKLAKDLHGMNVLADSDLHQLKILVEHLALADVYKKDIYQNGHKLELINTRGDEKIVPNPTVTAYGMISKTIITMFQQLGLTPASRAKAATLSLKEEEDPLAALMKKNVNPPPGGR